MSSFHYFRAHPPALKITPGIYVNAAAFLLSAVLFPALYILPSSYELFYFTYYFMSDMYFMSHVRNPILMTLLPLDILCAFTGIGKLTWIALRSVYVILVFEKAVHIFMS